METRTESYRNVGKDYKPEEAKYREAAHVMFFARTNRKLGRDLM